MTSQNIDLSHWENETNLYNDNHRWTGSDAPHGLETQFQISNQRPDIKLSFFPMFLNFLRQSLAAKSKSKLCYDRRSVS
jgi:hypothetical protein